jgi:hypothetical protein
MACAGKHKAMCSPGTVAEVLTTVSVMLITISLEM